MFCRYVAVATTSAQNLVGKDAKKSMVQEASTSVRFLRSAIRFCWGVRGIVKQITIGPKLIRTKFTSIVNMQNLKGRSGMSFSKLMVLLEELERLILLLKEVYIRELGAVIHKNQEVHSTTKWRSLHRATKIKVDQPKKMLRTGTFDPFEGLLSLLAKVQLSQKGSQVCTEAGIPSKTREATNWRRAAKCVCPNAHAINGQTREGLNERMQLRDAQGH